MYRRAFPSFIASTVIVLMACGGIPTANAAIVYTSQSSFAAATTAAGVDTFSGLSTTSATSSPINRAAGAYSYSASSSTSFYGAGSAANPSLSTNDATDLVTFYNFAPAISAIGGNFFGTDANGSFQTGNIALQLTDSLGVTSYTILSATTTSFVGFVSSGSITSLTVQAVTPNSAVWPTIDDLTLAQGMTSAVPETSTWAMMILGFAAIGYMAYRRRNPANTLAV
jgi:hypothetical protein